MTIEDITEIKDTEIKRCKQIGDQSLETTQEHLREALEICNKFGDLENKFQQVS